MSFFSRIGNIIRANFSFGSEPENTDTGRFYEEYRSRSSEKKQTHGSYRAENNSSRGAYEGIAYDPVVAQYYANLEVPYGADLETVRRSWKRLMRIYHPDLHSNDPEKQHIANQLVQELNHAYQELVTRLTDEKK